MAKISGYVKKFKDNDGDKNKNNELMSLLVDYIYIYIYTYCIYVKTKIKTYGDKVYTNFCSLNVPEDDIQGESFAIISIYSLLV